MCPGVFLLTEPACVSFRLSPISPISHKVFQWVGNGYWKCCCSLCPLLQSQADIPQASVGNCSRENECSSPSYTQHLQQPNEENRGPGRFRSFLQVKELARSKARSSVLALWGLSTSYSLYTTLETFHSDKFDESWKAKLLNTLPETLSCLYQILFFP